MKAILKCTLFFLFTWSLLLFYPDPGFAAKVSVTKVTYVHQQAHDSITVDLTGTAAIQSSRSPDLKTLTINIQNASLTKSVDETIKTRPGILKTARIYQPSPKTVRIHFIMSHGAYAYRTRMTRDPERLVIHIYPGQYVDEKAALQKKPARPNPVHPDQPLTGDEKPKPRDAESSAKLERISQEIYQAEQKKKILEEEIAQLIALRANLQKGHGADPHLTTTHKRFVVRDDGTVMDKTTKRMWMKNANYPLRSMVWEEAAKYCEDLRYAGYQDWRLPSRSEWEAFIGKKTGLDKAFPDGHPFENVLIHGFYWTSTPNPPGHAYTYAVNIETGHIETLKKERFGYVWPVRYAADHD